MQVLTAPLNTDRRLGGKDGDRSGAVSRVETAWRRACSQRLQHCLSLMPLKKKEKKKDGD